MKVSVIIAVFNTENLIERALQSVLIQNFPKKEMEIIVVNDGSTDKTIDVLNKYSKEIKIINQSNQGVVKAANVGFKKVAGDYVIKLDGDDYFEQGILKEFVSILDKNHHVDFAYSDYYEGFDGKRKLISPKNIFETVSCGIMYRRERLLETYYYNEQMFFAEYALLLKNPNWQGFHIKKPLYVYCRRNDSLTGDSKKIETGIKQLKEIFPKYIDEINKIRYY